MIIGLSGYARAGKNTVADILGSDYRQVSFAEPMRQILLVQNPIVDVGIDKLKIENRPYTLQDVVLTFGWDYGKENYPEIRRHLQVLGTQVGREMFYENFWVDLAMKDVKVGDDVVFTDVRFPNEAQAIVNLGGEVWRVNRPGVVAVNDHSSEHSLNDWNFHRIIENDGTIDELKEKILG